MLGEKTQKDGRTLPPRRLRDIKTEVGEDTNALLKGAKSQEKGEKKTRKDNTQVSLLPAEEKPVKAPIASSAAEALNIATINVKKLPDLSLMIEVRDLPELEKVGRTYSFINCFEDENRRVYFVGGYFYSQNR